MDRRTATTRRGAMLIIVLIVLAALSLVALSVGYRSRVELRLAQMQFDRAYVRQLAEAGLVVAMDRVRQIKDGTVHLGQPWHANLAVDDRWLAARSMRYGGSQSLQVSCTDEESRLNIRKADAATLAKLPDIGADVAAAIGDWMDADDNPTGGGGAESDYYLSLPAPYRAKNKPVESMNELLLVRGVTPELFYGEDANGNSRLDFAEDDGDKSFPPDNRDGVLQLGLRGLLTVHGSGKVNLNTAPVEVVMLLPGMSEKTARLIVRTRDGPDGEAGTRDDHPFASIEEVKTTCRLDDFENDVVSQFCQARSEYFRILSRASINDGRVSCQLEMIVHRLADGTLVPLSCQELAWK